MSKNFYYYCDKVLKKMERLLLPLPDMGDRGIIPSEGLAFLTMCEIFNVDIIIESGVYNGISTYIWSEFFGDRKKIIAIDKTLLPRTLKRFKNKSVTFVGGDGGTEISKLINVNKSKRIGIFVDGPKNIAAMPVVFNAIKNDNVVFVGLHDMYKHRVSGMPIEGRIKIQNSSYGHFFTDNKVFVKKYGYINKETKNIMVNPNTFEKMSLEEGKELTGSYGPVIGFVFKSNLLFNEGDKNE